MSLSPEQFNALIEQIKKNDERAIDIFTKYCYKAIKFYLYVRFSNNSNIDDWTQEIFMKIYYNLPTQYIKRPLAWLSAISHNHVITKIKQEKLTVELNNDILADEKFSNVLDKVTIEEIKKYIDEPTFNMFVLNSYCGYSFEEIAELLNLKAATVRQRIFRARERLKDVTIEL